MVSPGRKLWAGRRDIRVGAGERPDSDTPGVRRRRIGKLNREGFTDAVRITDRYGHVGVVRRIRTERGGGQPCPCIRRVRKLSARDLAHRIRVNKLPESGKIMMSERPRVAADQTSLLSGRTAAHLKRPRA